MKQARSRHQFTFYHSYIDCVMGLPKCRRFETLLAIIFYALDGTEPQLTGASDALFRAVKPNVDSSRVRAEQALKAREKPQAASEPRQETAVPDDARAAAPSLPADSGRDKAKKKNKNQSESEKETETEQEDKKERSALAADNGRPGAAKDAGLRLSLPALEREALDASFPDGQDPSRWEGAPNFDGRLSKPESGPPYAGMLEADPCLRVFWNSWLSRDRNGAAPSAREREALLKALKAAPPRERTQLLIARLKALDAEAPAAVSPPQNSV